MSTLSEQSCGNAEHLKRTQPHTNKHKHTPKHAQTHKQTHTYAHTHKHTHTHACTDTTHTAMVQVPMEYCSHLPCQAWRADRCQAPS